jgi:hypothetical protein
MFVPTQDSGVGEFYALWMTLFVLINVAWDVLTPRTDPFHLVHLPEKVDTLFSATTFASSLFLLLTIFQKETLEISGASKVPIVISGISGLLISLRYLCPYEIPPRNKGRRAGVNDPKISTP